MKKIIKQYSKHFKAPILVFYALITHQITITT